MRRRKPIKIFLCPRCLHPYLPQARQTEPKSANYPSTFLSLVFEFWSQLFQARCHRILIWWPKCNFFLFPQSQKDGWTLIFSPFNLNFKVKSKADYILVKLRGTRYTCGQYREGHFQCLTVREFEFDSTFAEHCGHSKAVRYCTLSFCWLDSETDLLGDPGTIHKDISLYNIPKDNLSIITILTIHLSRD